MPKNLQILDEWVIRGKPWNWISSWKNQTNPKYLQTMLETIFRGLYRKQQHQNILTECFESQSRTFYKNLIFEQKNKRTLIRAEWVSQLNQRKKQTDRITFSDKLTVRVSHINIQNLKIGNSREWKIFSIENRDSSIE